MYKKPVNYVHRARSLPSDWSRTTATCAVPVPVPVPCTTNFIAKFKFNKCNEKLKLQQIIVNIELCKCLT